jgi:hypothetical protein
MPTLIVENTGLDHLYEDGVPIAEISANISDIIGYVGRITALVAQTDPFFMRHTMAQKYLVELHGEGGRIFNDFLSLGASDILPVFQAMQRWMTAFNDSEGNPILMYEYDRLVPATDTAEAYNTGTIVYRWQIMDTRNEDYRLNYTSETLVDIRTDLNVVRNVQRYLIEALRDYVLMEFYKAIGHERKAKEYTKSYNQNRQYVAYWAKNDSSLQTARSNG